MIYLVPVTIDEANEFVAAFHEHNEATAGAPLAIGVTTGTQLVGVALIGRPVARMLQDGYTAEVLRVCVDVGAPKNVCSMLYGAAWRAWRAMGGRRIVTYTLATEKGTSVKAAGWRIVASTRPSKEGKGWDRDGRERDWQPVYGQKKFRWEPAA
jgi:hypothetical protein